MKSRIIGIISDVLGVSPVELGDNPSMEQLAIWDSVAQLNIIMSLEQEFSIQFTPDEVLQLSSLSAIEAALQSRGIA